MQFSVCKAFGICLGLAQHAIAAAFNALQFIFVEPNGRSTDNDVERGYLPMLYKTDLTLVADNSFWC